MYKINDYFGFIPKYYYILFPIAIFLIIYSTNLKSINKKILPIKFLNFNFEFNDFSFLITLINIHFSWNYFNFNF